MIKSMRKAFLPSAAAVVAVTGAVAFPSGPAMACESEPYIGMICTLGTNFCPSSRTGQYLPAEGQSVPIAAYPKLYAVIGSRFGGDGGKNFNFPDLRARVPVGAGQALGLSPVVLGEKIGHEAPQLTQDNLPAHTHSATFTAAANGGLAATAALQAVGDGTSASAAAPSAATPYLAGNPGTKMWAASSGTAGVAVKGVNVASGGTLTGVVTNANEGGGQPATIVPPQTGLTYCIAVEGVWPDRD